MLEQLAQIFAVLLTKLTAFFHDIDMYRNNLEGETYEDDAGSQFLASLFAKKDN